MDTLDLQAEIREFLTQRLPNDDQTRTANKQSLYKLKKLFLQDMRQSFQALGYILMLLQYLGDNSLVLLIFKSNMHYRASLARGKDKVTGADEAVLIGQRIIGTYIFSAFYHIIFGIFIPVTSDRFLHGSLTIQFIGEAPSSSTLLFLVYDVFTFAIAWIYFILMCQVEDLEILQPSEPSLSQEVENHHTRQQLDGNGLTGNVFLMTIKPIESLNAQQDAYMQLTGRQSTAFEQVGDLV